MNLKFYFFFIAAFISFITQSDAKINDSIINYNGQNTILLGNRVFILEDTSGKLSFNDIITSPNFKRTFANVPNAGVSNANIWIKFYIKNNTNSKMFSLEIENALLETVTLYSSINNGYTVETVTKRKPFFERKMHSPNGFFNIEIAPYETKKFFLKTSSATQLLIPIKFGIQEHISSDNLNRNILKGLYFGIIIVMILYNIFIYFSTKEKSYLLYILYIISVGLVQLNITGLGFKYLWPNSPGFERYSVYLFPSFTAFASIAFVKQFLNTKRYTPRKNKILSFFVFAYIITIINAFVGNKLISYHLLNIIALPLALLLIYIGIHIWFKHRYRPALFFLIAWTIFLFSVIGFVLKDFSIIPYNLFTVSLIQIGSALVVILLSIALADKINILQAETRESQRQALAALEENEQIVREQNVTLETQVKERTQKLEETNTELEQTLIDLKESEAQLVESEKMASLGQLTAGIAHEINNPINFVTSNVNPLKRDISMLVDLMEQIEEIGLQDTSNEEKQKMIEAKKTEIDYDYLRTEMDYLLKGIGDGASRTAEIVKGLRLFSRLDEDDIKLADINEGLDSTLVIINHLLNGRIEVKKKYSGIPFVECYPGKLNQVFLNMMSNAIYAIHERWQEQKGGTLTLATSSDETNVMICIKDNGIGMDEETKKKLFEPFFTTKEVGEGTGLGLSIAYNTIKKHNGNIEVNSEPDAGTEFTMIIPIKHQES